HFYLPATARLAVVIAQHQMRTTRIVYALGILATKERLVIAEIVAYFFTAKRQNRCPYQRQPIDRLQRHIEAGRGCRGVILDDLPRCLFVEILVDALAQAPRLGQRRFELYSVIEFTDTLKATANFI